MEIKIKKLPKGKIELIVELSALEFDKFLKRAEEELSFEKEIPGFRPGRAPIEVIRKEIGETKIYERGAKLAIEETYWQSVLEKNLKPIELPKIEILKIARGNPFIYKATFSVLPEIKIGEITTAIKDTSINGIGISEGDIIGIVDDEICFVGKDINEIALKILDKILNNKELLTIYYGKDISKEEAEKLYKLITQKHPNISVELIYGGQPFYFYYLGVE